MFVHHVFFWLKEGITENDFQIFENVRKERQEEKNLLIQIIEEIDDSAKSRKIEQNKLIADMVREVEERVKNENSIHEVAWNGDVDLFR